MVLPKITTQTGMILCLGSRDWNSFLTTAKEWPKKTGNAVARLKSRRGDPSSVPAPTPAICPMPELRFRLTYRQVRFVTVGTPTWPESRSVTSDLIKAVTGTPDGLCLGFLFYNFIDGNNHSSGGGSRVNRGCPAEREEKTCGTVFRSRRASRQERFLRFIYPVEKISSYCFETVYDREVRERRAGTTYRDYAVPARCFTFCPGFKSVIV